MKPRILFLITLLCAAIAGVQSVHASTITVQNTGDGLATPANCPGSSCRLRDALAASLDNDTVDFSITGTITLTSGQLVVDKSVTVNGPGANNLAVDGNGDGRVFYIGSGKTVTISGLTITHGDVAGTNFPANAGGGIFNDHATLTVTDSTLSGNTAFSGGGIFNDGEGEFGSATLTINNSTVSGNVTFGGGAVYNDGESMGSATLTITDSTLSDNSAVHDGGGIANDGGAMGFATLTITNSTLSSNSASNSGGIYNTEATLTIGNTILNAGTSGANIFNDFGTVTSLGYNLSSDAAGGDGTTGPGGLLNHTGDMRNTDPMLGPLQDNGGSTFTNELLTGSLAINMGNPSFTPPPSYDQRGPGFPRVANGRIDIGAFEVQASPSPTLTPTATSTPTATATATFTPTPTPTPSPTPEATNLALTAATGTYGGMVTLSATLTSSGSPVSGKTITFVLNGTNGTGITDGTGVVTVTNVSLSGINAGTYPSGVAASFAGDGGYSGSTGTAGLTVTPRGLTVTASGIDKVYDGTNAAMVTLSDDRIAGDSLAVAYAAASFADKNAGVKPVSVSGISISGSDAGNYNLLNIAANTTANITLRSLLITAQDQSKTYGATFTFAGTEFSVGTGQLVTGDSVTSVTLSSAGAAATAPAGTYPITPSAAVGSGLSNYAIGYADGSFTVFRSPTSIVYTGFTNGAYLDTKQASAIVSSATVPPVGTSVHFSLVPFSGGLELQGCTGTIDASGFASCSLQLVQPSGTYVLVATALGNGNFDSSSTSATITIFVPDTNLAVTAATGTYGGMVTLSATLTGLGSPVSGKTITFVLNGTNGGTGVTDGAGVATVTNVSLAGINAGTYPLGVVANFAGDGSYLPATGTAALTVNPAYAAQIQQPVNADGSSVFNVKRGVIPVKFTLTLNGVATCNLPPATIAVYRTGTGGNQLIDESVYEGSADTGSNFRITGCQYIYNLSASALGVGAYRVDIKINNQIVGSAFFQLR